MTGTFLPTISPNAVTTAVDFLSRGNIIALPTDTVYGLAARLYDIAAIEQLFKLKKRDPNKAFAIFIKDLSELDKVARDVPSSALVLLKKYWPGALTAVFNKDPYIPDVVTRGKKTVAIRIPNHFICLEILKKLDQPLVVTSANISGQATPTTAKEIAAHFANAIPFILSGEIDPHKKPSSIIDFTQTPPTLLREGDLTFEDLKLYLSC